MTKDNIIIYGAGGHAKSCIEVIDSQKKYKILGLIGKKNELNNTVSGYKVIGTDQDLPVLKKKVNNIVVGFSPINVKATRKNAFEKLKSIGFKFPKIIASTSYISRNANIGEGTVIFHKSFVNSGVFIGKNCIINTGSIIEHDAVINDHCNISTSVTINGNVEIGTNCFVGSGTKIIQSIKINNNTLIPMLSKILQDK